MAKKKQSMEFLREKAHLRSRTNTIGAVARIRNALAFATHRCGRQQPTLQPCRGKGLHSRVSSWGI
jgi:hypothetical protein